MKWMPHSGPRREQFSCCMLETPFWKIDSRLGCTQCQGCQIRCTPSTEWCKPWLQTLQRLGKVFQLHYLCESAVRSDNIPCESSSGLSTCLVMRLKRSPHLWSPWRSRQDDGMDAMQWSDASNGWEQMASSNSISTAFLPAWSIHRSIQVCTTARKPAYLFAARQHDCTFEEDVAHVQWGLGLVTSTCFSARVWNGLVLYIRIYCIATSNIYTMKGDLGLAWFRQLCDIGTWPTYSPSLTA